MEEAASTAGQYLTISFFCVPGRKMESVPQCNHERRRLCRVQANTGDLTHVNSYSLAGRAGYVK
jgi:hypothetical protein